MAVLLCSRLRLHAVFLCPVSGKALQFADRDSFSLDAADTFSFALGLLRTYTAADSGQRTRLADRLIGAAEVSALDLLNEGGNVDPYRASCHTLRIFAVETAG